MSDQLGKELGSIRMPVHHEHEGAGRWAVIDRDQRMVAVTRGDGGQQLAKKICEALNYHAVLTGKDQGFL